MRTVECIVNIMMYREKMLPHSSWQLWRLRLWQRNMNCVWIGWKYCC